MRNEFERLSSLFNVTGAESALANYLLEFFQRKNVDAKLDPLGNVIAKKSCNKDGCRKLMICSPLDNPGYIALYTEGKTAYLTGTEKSVSNLKTVKEVIGQDGKTYPLLKNKYSRENFSVTGRDFKLGEVFRLPTTYSQEKEKISGRFVTRYALIALLMELASELSPSSCDLIFCFTTGFHSFAKSEGSIAFREKPTDIILLGFAEENSDRPILMHKDAKHFASPRLIETITRISAKEKLALCSKASDSPVTKADTIAFPGGSDVISLALPCRFAGTEKEALRINAYSSLKTLLDLLIRKI